MIRVYNHPYEEFMDRLKLGVKRGTHRENRLIVRHVDWPFVVWTKPGGKVWSGLIGMYYSKAHTYLSDASKGKKLSGMWLHHETLKEVWVGRFGKAQKRECLALIAKLDKLRRKKR